MKFQHCSIFHIVTIPILHVNDVNMMRIKLTLAADDSGSHLTLSAL